MMERIRRRFERAAFRYTTDVRIRISVWGMVISLIIYVGELSMYGFSEVSNRFWEFISGLGCGVSMTLSIQVNRDHDREREAEMLESAEDDDTDASLE